MKKNKQTFNFNIRDVIQANLGLQTVQRTLEKSFGLYKFDVNTILDNKYINNFNKWDEDKKSLFISTIGGKANFYKTKKFIETKLIEENKL
jgi:hypothetical protein